MSKSNASSPGRSLGPITPRRNTGLSRSVSSQGRSGAKGTNRTAVDHLKVTHRDSFMPSPLSKTVLNDNTDIEEPRRESWWKNVDNSQDIMEVLTEKPVETDNIVDAFDVEILSQENKENNTLDIPESSGSESIGSIVVPQRKLFTQKEISPQKKFNQIIGTRELMTKLDKSHIEDKSTNVGTKNLFGQGVKRSKPMFPAALLNISPNKTIADKTKELLGAELAGPSKNLFGNRAGTKRKNMFTDFIMSESEDEIPDIETRRFTFTKQPLPLGRKSSASRGGTSPASSVTTDIELDEWKCLPSSTMMEHQLEDANTPARRARLSKLIETRETINTNSTVNKSRQSVKSGSLKNKSVVSDTVKESENKNKVDAANKIDDINKSKQLSKSDIEGLAKENPRENNIEVVVNIVGQEDQIKDIQEINEDNDKNRTLIHDEDNHEGSIKKRHSATQIKETTNAQKLMAQKERSLVSETPMPRKSKSVIMSKVVNETPEAILVEEEQQNSILDIEKEKDAVFKPSQELRRSIIKQDENKNANEDDQEIFTRETHKNDKEPANDVDMVTDEPEKSQNVHVTYAIDNKDSETIAKDQEVEVSNNGKTGEFNNENFQAEKLNQDQIEAEEDIQDEEQIEEHKAVSKNEEDNDIEIEEIEENDEEMDEQMDETEENNDAEMEYSEEYENVSVIENNEQNKEEVEEHDVVSEIENEDPNESEIAQSENEVEENESGSEIENEEHNESEIIETEEENEDEIEEHNESEIIETEEQNEDDSEEHNESIIETEEQNEDEIEESEELIRDEMDKSEEQNDDEMENTEELNDEAENTEEKNEDKVETEEHEGDSDREIKEHEGASEIEDEEQNEEVQEEIEDSNIPDTPNASHDITGRYRKKIFLQSPEAALFNKTNTESFIKTKGRNTSIRKSVLKKNFSVRPSIAPPRESTGISNGTKNSSTEGSGWDSHRNERKTLRLTLGKDFSPRKSLRALVMEKSDKRKTVIDEANAELRIHQENHHDSDQDMDHHNNVSNEVSLRTRQTTLEQYLEKKKQEYIERKIKIDEEVRRSVMLNNTKKHDILNSRVPMKLSVRKPLKTLQVAPKVQRVKRTLVSLDDLPPELIEDMKYKPPKRFRASNAPWITKRLYKFLESKLEPKYDYKARVRAERLVESIYTFVQGLRRLRVASSHSVAELKKEMARLDIVKTHYEFYNFINEFMPREVKFKVVPDLANEIPVPRNGVFSDILD